ncbi:MAG: hypothetical protein BAJALOKI3v1_220039 [Promethearchaeota archaeon]|nr:MAG: hypothetical protein BAJALOKI3v1_220039 [Candidatus Lokiarchaeota archaeon]
MKNPNIFRYHPLDCIIMRNSLKVKCLFYKDEIFIKNWIMNILNRNLDY